jgi:serine/threonine protein kinase
MHIIGDKYEVITISNENFVMDSSEKIRKTLIKTYRLLGSVISTGDNKKFEDIPERRKAIGLDPTQKILTDDSGVAQQKQIVVKSYVSNPPSGISYGNYTTNGRILGAGGLGEAILVPVLKKRVESLQGHETQIQRGVAVMKRSEVDFSFLAPHLDDKTIKTIRQKYIKLVEKYLRNPFHLSEGNLNFRGEGVFNGKGGFRSFIMNKLGKKSLSAEVLENLRRKVSDIYCATDGIISEVRARVVVDAIADEKNFRKLKTDLTTIPKRPIIETREDGRVILCSFSKVRASDLQNAHARKVFNAQSEDEKAQQLLNMLIMLKAFHDNEYVHGDIKPANMFVSKDGTLSMGDFGSLLHSSECGKGPDVQTIPYLPDYYTREDGHFFEKRVKKDLFAVAISFIDILTNNKLDEEQRKSKRSIKDIPPKLIELPQKLQGFLKYLYEQKGCESTDQAIKALLKLYPKLKSHGMSETFMSSLIPKPLSTTIPIRKRIQKQRTVLSTTEVTLTLKKDDDLDGVYYLQRKNGGIVDKLVFDTNDMGAISIDGYKFVESDLNTPFVEWLHGVDLALPLKIHNFSIDKQTTVKEVIDGIKQEVAFERQTEELIHITRNEPFTNSAKLKRLSEGEVIYFLNDEKRVKVCKLRDNFEVTISGGDGREEVKLRKKKIKGVEKIIGNSAISVSEKDYNKYKNKFVKTMSELRNKECLEINATERREIVDAEGGSTIYADGFILIKKGSNFKLYYKDEQKRGSKVIVGKASDISSYLEEKAGDFGALSVGKRSFVRGTTKDIKQQKKLQRQLEEYNGATTDITKEFVKQQPSQKGRVMHVSTRT